jgi:intracellular sulfur oxidation DsrE/DsrF family protein
MLVSDKSRVADNLNGFAARGVVFSACQFSMKERKVAPEQLLPSVKQVPAGIIYIVTKQEEGFHYIKSGF